MSNLSINIAEIKLDDQYLLPWMNETECVDIVDDLSETETVDYFGYKDISVCLLIDAFSFVIQKERL